MAGGYGQGRLGSGPAGGGAQGRDGCGRAVSCAPPGAGSSRHKKSLGLLTAKFVSLLQEAKDCVLDLKAAADYFGCEAKKKNL